MLVTVCHCWTSWDWAGGATCLWVLFWKHWIFVQLEDCIPCALIPTCRKEILFLKPKSCTSIHVLLYIYNNTLLLFDKDMHKTRQLSGWRENILSIHHKVKHRQVRKKTNHSTYSHEMKILASQKICISNFVRWTFASKCIEHCIRWLLSGRCRDIRGMAVLRIFAVTCPRRVNTTHQDRHHWKSPLLRKLFRKFWRWYWQNLVHQPPERWSLQHCNSHFE